MHDHPPLSAVSASQSGFIRRLLGLPGLRPGRHRTRLERGLRRAVAQVDETVETRASLYRERLMITRRSRLPREEYPVVVSLVVSLGMILTAIAGTWLWRTLARIGEAAMAITSLEIP